MRTTLKYISGPRVGEVITWQSQPNYDNWGWDDYWDCWQWKEWHVALESHYGLAVANQIWVAAWLDQDGTANPFNWCKYDSDWVDYFESKGLDMGHFLSDLFGAGTNLGEGAADLVDGVASTASTIGSVLPIILIGTGLYLGYEYYQNYKKRA